MKFIGFRSQEIPSLNQRKRVGHHHHHPPAHPDVRYLIANEKKNFAYQDFFPYILWYRARGVQGYGLGAT